MYFNNIFLQYHFLNASKYDINMIHHTVNHRDPDICTEVEANYSGHLNKGSWDALSQTHALQKLLVIARKSEVKVYGMRNLIAHQTTQDLLINSTAFVGSVEGLTTAVATSAAVAYSAASTISSTSTYSLASQADNTLR